MAFEVDLMTGIADLLAGDGSGTWSPSGVYDPAQTGIVLRARPEHMDNLITLAVYPLADGDGNATVGLQVFTRRESGDPRDVDELDEQIFYVLHGMWSRTLSTGVPIVQCLRTSGSSMGQDSSKRWSRVSNYSIKTTHPSAASTF